MRFNACRSKLNSPFMPPSRPTLTMRPSRAAASMFWLATLAETWSTIRSTPLPAVASLTLSGHLASRVSSARSQPNSFSRARRPSLVEVPMTIEAPICLAICMPRRPTPELAPWTGADQRVVHGLHRHRHAGGLLVGHVVGRDLVGAAGVGDGIFGEAAGGGAH